MHEPISDYHKQAYLWLSVTLALPIFLWPALLLFGFTPAFGISIEQNWLVAACFLLMTAVTADSILSYRPHISHVIASAIWIMLVSSIVSLAIRNPDIVWFIATLFALRSAYVSHSLWQAKSKLAQWWQWVAWWRDSSTALAIFLWLNYWPQ